MKMTVIPCKTTNYKPTTARQIQFIVLHYTANKNDTAANNGAYFARENVGASAHYFVDENEAVLSVNENDIAWHCETPGLPFSHKVCRNNNSLAIEMCTAYKDGKHYISDKTAEKTLELTKHLMKKYNIPVSRVLRHYDVKPKLCPMPWIKNESLWFDFLKRLEEVKLTYEEALKIIKDKCGFDDNTMLYLEMYRYSESMVIRLAEKMK